MNRRRTTELLAAGALLRPPQLGGHAWGDQELVEGLQTLIRLWGLSLTMQPREVDDWTDPTRGTSETSDELLEGMRREYQQSWSEVADFLRVLEEMGDGGYKLTGPTQAPVVIYVDIS